MKLSLRTLFSQSRGVLDRNEPRLPFDIGHSRNIPWVVILHARQCLQLLPKLIPMPLYLLQQHRPIVT